MRNNQLSRYGAIAKALPFTMGKIFFVSSSSDSWTADFQTEFPADFDGNVRVFTDIASAYDATVSGRNDVIVVGSNASFTLTSMLTVSKNRVHFVSSDWLAGVRRIQDQRSRIQMSVAAGATNVATIKVTGNGCSFRGLKIINSSTVTESLSAFYDASPNGLYMENCTIHSLGAAQLTATGGSALKLSGDGSTYKECQIGDDTVISSVANQVVSISEASAAKRVIFQGCYFYAWASSADAVFVRATAGSVDRYVIFNDCMFTAFTGGGGLTLTTAMASALAGTGMIYVSNSNAFGVTDFATAAKGNGGMQIVSVVPTAGTSGIGITPTA